MAPARGDAASLTDEVAAYQQTRDTRYQWTHGGHLEPGAGEIVIYFYLPEPGAAGWYFKSGRIPRTPLFIERGNSRYAGRIQYFLDTIAALAAKSQ